ncbi:TPA: hypothetical protein HA253_04525 [Candidatus Woesearchaeota archaeon]|nr:hypothetical protein [Candidatus Woesearchaeota archaeon]
MSIKPDISIFTREIPGRCHESNEDSHYAGIIPSKEGDEYGLFMIADGLSGYSGSAASHIAVAQIKKYLENNLPDNDDYAELMQRAAYDANTKLANIGTTRTTLDAVLYGPAGLFGVHFGDSRVYFVPKKNSKNTIRAVTKDESRQGVPTNYLGCVGLYHPLERKIGNPYSFTPEELKDLRYIVLMTDGFMARATKDEIITGLRDLQNGNGPEAVFNFYAQILINPRNRLLEVQEQEIRQMLYGIAGVDISNPKGEKLVEYVLDCYTQRQNAEIVERLDNGLEGGRLKSDDATLVIVDVQAREEDGQIQKRMAEDPQKITPARCYEALLSDPFQAITALDRETAKGLFRILKEYASTQR